MIIYLLKEVFEPFTDVLMGTRRQSRLSRESGLQKFFVEVQLEAVPHGRAEIKIL
jgi:hypothetical protein